jgi:hypothetical protein
MRNRWRWLMLLLLLLMATGAGVYWFAEDLFVPAPALDVSGREALNLLPPGTVVGDTAPEGWTHLVLKSQPHVHSGAVNKLTAEGEKYASFLFMVTIARVKDQGTPFRPNFVLEDVAMGLGTTVNGKDMVLSPERQAEFGANLHIPYNLILKGAYNKQLEARYLIHGKTFVVYDTPVLMHRGDGNREILFRYALLVERKTGRLETLVWGIDRKQDSDPLIGPIEWLQPGTIDPASLYVDPHEFALFGLPGPNAFAAEGLPHGQRQMPIPEDLIPLLGQRRYTAQEAQELHRALLHLMRPTATSGGAP